MKINYGIIIIHGGIMENNLKKYRIKEKKTLNQKVYQSIKNMIFDGELQGGDKLNEVDIANALGVSATPVRETFRMLSTEGLVEIIPYKGVFVREYTPEEIKSVYECRRALENLALELAIDKLEKSKLLEFLETINEENAQISSYDVSNAIHDYILQTSGNKTLLDLVERLNYMLLHDRMKSAKDPKRKAEICEEHRELILALLDKDLELSKKLMTEHINKGYEYIKKDI